MNLEKPDTCILCCDALGKEEKPLECGHWMHLACVQKHFKPECPLCRRRLDIRVSGTLPSTDTLQEYLRTHNVAPMDAARMIMSHHLGNNNGDDNDDVENDRLMYYEDENDGENGPNNGYQYAEEDPEYDDQNPHGDTYEYGD